LFFPVEKSGGPEVPIFLNFVDNFSDFPPISLPYFPILDN